LDPPSLHDALPIWSDAATLIPQQFKIAQTIPHPVWFGQWVDFANKQALLPALRQDIQVADAVDKMSTKAKALNTPYLSAGVEIRLSARPGKQRPADPTGYDMTLPPLILVGFLTLL